MENNENNVQNQEKKKSKGLTVGLVIIMLILVLAIGVGGGYWLSKNGNLFNNNETKSNTDAENKNDKKVVKVVSNQKGEKQMVIEGKDSNNNTVWTYTTPIENVPQEAINRGQKLIETRKGKVYLCDWGKLYILDEQTGKVLAKNTEHNIGAVAVYTFDENDNLYTTSYLAAVDKFDTNANLLKTTESKIWDKGFYWPKNMTLEGNKLVIDYGEEGIVTVNKDTLEIIDSKSNNTASNQTTSNNNTAVNSVQKYLGKWYDEDNSSELKILSIANNYCSFTWAIYRTAVLDNTVIPIKNNTATFYFKGYDDKNFNSKQDEGEYYYRRATLSLNNDSITIKVENIDAADYDVTQEKMFDGQVHINEGIYTYKIK